MPEQDVCCGDLFHREEKVLDMCICISKEVTENDHIPESLLVCDRIRRILPQDLEHPAHVSSFLFSYLSADEIPIACEKSS